MTIHKLKIPFSEFLIDLVYSRSWIYEMFRKNYIGLDTLYIFMDIFARRSELFIEQ